MTPWDFFLLEWATPFMLSIILTFLLATVAIIIKLTYSRTNQLTQLSMYPYYLIAIYLIFEAFEITLVGVKIESGD